MEFIILQIIMLFTFSAYSYSQDLSLEDCIEYAFTKRILNQTILATSYGCKL